MIDLAKFWQAFKFSWFRRMSTTNSVWPNILEKCIQLTVGGGQSINQILQLGPTEFNKLAKNIANPFWKEVFAVVRPIMEGAIFTSPEKFLLSPFWGNPQIKRAGRPIKYGDFNNIVMVISKDNDFFNPENDDFS